MPYQNNNSRAVPRAIEDRNLRPAATPTDKLLRYSPQYGQTGGYVNTAKALSDIGRGLMDIDTLLRIQSQDNALRAVWETEQAGGNKKDWKDVSKQVKGFAKFNPYNDDAYRKLQSEDIYRAAYLELITTPDLDKLGEDKFYQLVGDTSKKMIEAFKETGLSPRDYGNTLVQWDENMKALEQNWVIRHKDYTYKQLQIKQASDLSFQAGDTLYTSQGLDKSLVLQDTINLKLQELSDLGMSEETQLNVVLAGMQGFLSKNADSITGAEFKAAVKNIMIEGKRADEIIPNFDAQVDKAYRDAVTAIYEDKRLAFQDHNLDLQISAQEASKELYNWVQQNPNANNAQTLQQAQELINKYDLEENGFDFIGQVAKDKSTLEEFQNVQSDNSLLQELGAKAALGELTGEEVSAAVRNGQLNWKDALTFTDRINREAKAELTGAKQTYNEFHSKLGKTGIYGQQLGANSADIKKINDQANQLIIDLNNGTKTPEEVRLGLQQLERITQAKARMKQNRAVNDSFLLNANYIRSQTAPMYKADTAINAFKRLGLERGKVGQKIQPQITSAPNDNRVVRGKSAPHKGYDLAATNDTRVHSVNMKGTCIYAGYEPNGFGNYVVIKYDNGTYMRAGHFSTSTKHLQGKTIPAGMYLGNAGSTGFSTGTHLHVDFWDRNRQLIGVERFQSLMR